MNTKDKAAYRLFAIAVVVYIGGVLAFSSWSFLEHRAVIQESEALSPSTSQSRKVRKVALIEGSEVLFLMAMAFPLIALYRRARIRNSRRLEELNAQLADDCQKLKEREAELKDAVSDIERFNALTTGRENRITELKIEVNTILEQMNKEKRYNIAHVD